MSANLWNSSFVNNVNSASYNVFTYSRARSRML